MTDIGPYKQDDLCPENGGCHTAQICLCGALAERQERIEELEAALREGQTRQRGKSRIGQLATEAKRIEELEAASTWQPINTAPKDYSTILGFGKDSKDDELYVAMIFYDDEERKWFSTGPIAIRFYPSHWMPLPNPPKETGDE